MKYATAAFAAALLCSGAAFAASSDGLASMGQYHKSNMQNANDMKTTGNDTTTDTKAKVDSNGCEVSGGGREMTGSNAANTPDMNSQVGRQDTTTQTASSASTGGTKCPGKNPPIAPPMNDPGPK